MLNAESRLLPNEAEVTAQVLDGEAVLINISTGIYHSMNGAGGAIWPLVERGHSLEQIATAVSRDYDVSVARALADLETLAERLIAENLVIVSEGAPPPLETGPERAKLPYEPPTLETYRDMSDLLALDPPMPGLQEIPWEDPGSQAS